MWSKNSIITVHQKWNRKNKDGTTTIKRRGRKVNARRKLVKNRPDGRWTTGENHAKTIREGAIRDKDRLRSRR